MPPKFDKTSFFADVHDVVRLIPKGRVTTYGAIAAFLGSKRGARMVGWAMNAAVFHDDVPAQRVVNRKGLLTGKHHFTETSMEDLLKADGVAIKDDQVVNFKEVFWNPLTELE